MDGIDIERRIARANELHEQNYNCAQCVAFTCCDLVDLDERVVFKLLEGFGGGMGNNTQTCGALSGAVAVVSYAASDGPHNPTTKKETYAKIGPMVEEFRDFVGSTICNEIKGQTGGPVLRPCSECIAEGIRLVVARVGEL